MTSVAQAQLPLRDQPMHVRLTQFNWSSTFFPTVKKGLNQRRTGCKRPTDCLSPSEKLDLFTDHKYGFREWVKERNSTANLIETFWSGYCDSIASLQLSFPHLTLQDKEFVSQKTQFTFYPDDIIGIAALAVSMGKVKEAQYEQIAERCDRSRLTLNRKALNALGCRDFEAIVFHRALTEEVAVGKTYIAEFAPYAWVDNGVINGYDLETTTIDQNHIRVKATLFTYKVQYASLRNIYQPKTISHTYEYELTLNEQGVPTSARWLTSNQPDFFWRQTVIQFTDEFSFLNSYFNESH